MRAIVHIGTAKTGTTSIQRFLRDNRALLGERGYVVPAAMGEDRHDALAVMGLDPQPVMRVHRRVGIHDAGDLPGYVARTSEAMRAAVTDAPPGSTMILTSEDLSTLLVRQEQVARFVAWLHSCGITGIEVLVYLRRQDAMQIAAYSTSIKAGGSAPFTFPAGDTAAGPSSRMNYAALLDRWSDAVDPGVVAARLFQRSDLVEGDVVHDFLHAIGLTETEALRFPRAANTSLDATALEYLRLINRHVPVRIGGRRNPLRGRLAPNLGRVPVPGQPHRPDPAAARAFLARFDQSNADVARRYFGRADGVLFDTSDLDRALSGSVVAEVVEPGLTVEKAVELAAHMWIAQRKQIDALRRTLRLEEESGDRDLDDESDD